MTTLIRASALALALLATGCLRYGHDQNAFGPDGKLVPIDRTRLNSFIFTGTASKIRSEIKQTGTNFSRVVTVGAVQGGPDNEFIKSVISGAVEGGMRGAAAAVKP